MDIFAYPAIQQHSLHFYFSVKVCGAHNKLKHKCVIIVKIIAASDYVNVITLLDHCKPSFNGWFICLEDAAIVECLLRECNFVPD